MGASDGNPRAQVHPSAQQPKTQPKGLSFLDHLFPWKHRHVQFILYNQHEFKLLSSFPVIEPQEPGGLVDGCSVRGGAK